MGAKALLRFHGQPFHNFGEDVEGSLKRASDIILKNPSPILEGATSILACYGKIF